MAEPVTLYLDLPHGHALPARTKIIAGILKLMANERGDVLLPPVATLARLLGQRGKGGGSLTRHYQVLRTACLLVKAPGLYGPTYRLTY